MPNYLERYQNGEYKQVWDELLALGDAIREEPLYSEALAVAQETMGRTKKNIETLIERRHAINYKFSPEKPILEPVTESTWNIIASIEEQAGGPIPLALRVFYEVVGEVRFYGLHLELGDNLAGSEAYFENPEWAATLNEEEVEFYYGEGSRVAPTSDPLVVEAPVFDESLEYYSYGYSSDKYYVAIAPDADFKADYSGSGPYLLGFPCLAIDEIMEGARDKYTFVEYLREVFQWGGFPGFKYEKTRPVELLEYLAKDLLPL